MVESKPNNGLADEQFQEPKNNKNKTDDDANPDIVFICRKCEHNLFISKEELKKIWDLPNTDCPFCGEEGERNWIIDREGNFIDPVISTLHTW